MAKEKGVGPYARNDVKFDRDTRYDDSGNVRAPKREIPDAKIEANSDFAKKMPKR